MGAAEEAMTKRHAAIAVVSLIKWPLLGALFAGGAIGMGRWLAPKYLPDTLRDLSPTVRDLGAEAGAGFAEGVIRVQQFTAATTALVSGRWSAYR